MFDQPTPYVRQEESMLSDMGGIHIHVQIVTANGKVIASKTQPLPKPGTAYAPAGANIVGP
jgi:hypothetical protein